MGPPIWLAVLLAFVQPTFRQGAPPSPSSAVRTFIAAGTLTPAARERLQKALGAVEGVQKLEFSPGTSGFTVRITGRPLSNEVMVAGMKAGFDFRPSPTRTFTATLREAPADAAALKESLVRTTGVELVEVQQAGTAYTVRVQGMARAGDVISAARTAGFDLRRSLMYVASGPADGKVLSRLHDSLSRVPGVEHVDVAGLAGGATLTVLGTMDEDGLQPAAKAAGYALQPINIPPVARLFSIAKWTGPADEEKLKRAIESLGGAGDLQIMEAKEGAQLAVRGGVLSPSRILAAARAAGFDLQVIERTGLAAGPTEAERNTPPAFDERVNEDITRVGDMAPDFTLITKDAKTRITLSSFRNKLPVVLIFGSYT